MIMIYCGDVMRYEVCEIFTVERVWLIYAAMTSSDESHVESCPSSDCGDDDSDFEPQIVSNKKGKLKVKTRVKTNSISLKQSQHFVADIENDSSANESGEQEVDDTKKKKKRPLRTSVDLAFATSQTRNKKAKKKIIPSLSDNDALTTISEYMIEQNRPYSAQNVFDNLHQSVKKSMVPKILEKLCSSGVVQEKIFKKTKIYLAHQSQFESRSNDLCSEKNAEIIELKELNSSLLERSGTLKAQLTTMRSTPTLSNLELTIAEKRSLSAEKKHEQSTISSNNSDPLSPRVFKKSKEAVKTILKTWRDRKRSASDVVDLIIGEELENPTKLMATIGVETDKDSNQDLAALILSFST